MSDSQKTTKKELRLISKKRKLESFLELIKGDDQETSKKLHLKNSKKDKKKNSSNNPREDHKIATKTSTSTSDDDISKESTDDITKDNKLDMTKDSECDSPPFKKTKLNLSENEMKKVREEIRLRQKAAMEFPKIFLTLDPHTFKHQPHTQDGRPILYIQDIQHLILHATQGHTTSYKPRWCKLLRTQKVSKVLLIIVDGASCQDYYTDSSMSFLKANFEMSLEFISPSQYSRSLTGELFNIPVSNRKSLDEFQQSGFKTSLSKSCSVDNNNNNNVTNVGNNNNDNINKNINKRDADDAKADATNNNNNINNNNNNKTSNYYYNNFFNNTFKPPNDKTSTSVVASPMTSSVTSPLPATKCDLMLTVDEMKMEGYTLPLAHHVKSGKYVFSKDAYIVPSDKSPIFAVDCEMVETLKSQSELAWISVVDEDLECIYESLVRPEHPVTDYLTRYSGITEQLLAPIKTTLEDVQHHLQRILPPDVILAGQSLNMDLNAMKMYHPFVIDTSCLYNLSGQKHCKSNLKTLASVFLNRSIQRNGCLGHNPREDAGAVMMLVKKKLKNGLSYGNVMNGWSFGQLKDDDDDNDDDDNGDDDSDDDDDNKNNNNNNNDNNNNKTTTTTAGKNNNSSDNKVDEVVFGRGVNRDNDNDEDISNGISCNVVSKDNNNNNVDDVTREDDNNNNNQPPEPENHRHLDDKQQQISMFFRLNKHTTSLFKLLVRDRKKTAILGLPNFLTSLKQQHNSINTNDPDFKQFIKVIKDGDDDYDGGDDENEDGDVLDKKMMRRCREELESGDSSFLIGRFCNVGRSLDCTENKVLCARCLKRSLKSTDKNIKKLYNALPEKSLMIVLLAGRSFGPDNSNGLCLVKVKTAQ